MLIKGVSVGVISLILIIVQLINEKDRMRFFVDLNVLFFLGIVAILVIFIDLISLAKILILSFITICFIRLLYLKVILQDGKILFRKKSILISEISEVSLLNKESPINFTSSFFIVSKNQILEIPLWLGNLDTLLTKISVNENIDISKDVLNTVRIRKGFKQLVVFTLFLFFCISMFATNHFS